MEGVDGPHNRHLPRVHSDMTLDQSRISLDWRNEFQHTVGFFYSVGFWPTEPPFFLSPETGVKVVYFR